MYTSDVSNTIFLFSMRNNSLVYYNSHSNIIRMMTEYKSLTVLNIKISLNNELIILLYSNGDFFIIPLDLIENSMFESIWEKLSQSKESKNNNNSSLKGRLIQSIISKNVLINTNAPIFSEFLICGGNIGVSSSKEKGFFYKNIIDYLHQTKDKDSNNRNETIIIEHITCASMELWLNDKTEYIIISFENNILIINQATGECVIDLQCTYQIYSILLLNYMNIYEYIIIQTEKEYYSLTLYDEDNNIILSKDKSITPIVLSLSPHTILSIQQYNGERVLCCLTQYNSFDVYNLLDLTKPLFQVNLSNQLYLRINEELLNCFLYQKMLIAITKNDSKYYMSAINYWITNNQMMRCNKDKKKEMMLWCNSDYSLLKNSIIIEKELEGKVIMCNTMVNDKTSNVFTLYILSKNSLVSYTPIVNNIMLSSVTKVLKENFSYHTLRKLEMLNHGLGDSLFDYIDIMTNEISKEKEIMLKLIWASPDISNQLLFNIIKTLDDVRIAKNSFVFKNDLIDYLLFHLVDQRGKINTVYCGYLWELYINLIIKKDYAQEINKQLEENVKELCVKYFEKEYDINQRHTSNDDGDLSISSLVQLNTSTSENDDGNASFNNLSMQMPQGVVMVTLNVPKSKKKQNHFGIDNTIPSSILPNNFFHQLKITNEQIVIISSSLPTIFPYKELYEKILLIAFSSPNYLAQSLDNRDINDLLLSKFKESLFHSDDHLNHIKSFIIYILLNNTFTISDRIIEEILIIKFNNQYIQIDRLISFIIKLFKYPSILYEGYIYLNSFTLFQSNVSCSKYGKDSQTLSHEAIESYFNDSLIKFLNDNNQYINRKIIQLKSILSILFLFYFYRSIIINKKRISNPKSIEALKDYMKILADNNHRQNKYLWKYIDEIRLVLYSKESNEENEDYRRKVGYYECILKEMKSKKEQLVNKTLTLNELIEDNTNDIFKQKNILKYYNNQ